MPRINQKVTVGELKLELTRSAGLGGQGEVFMAVDQHGRRHAVKMFHPTRAHEDLKRRTAKLVEARLHERHAALFAPHTHFEHAGRVAHIAPWASGETLENLVDSSGRPDYDFAEGLQAGCALAHGLSVLHAMGIAHGDLHDQNVRIARVEGSLQVQLIDLDNFSLEGCPLPTFIGQPLFMAPELRTGARSSIQADCYALMVLLHQFLLLSHPAGGYKTEQEFLKAMTSGVWPLDPTFAAPQADRGGYPAQILNARVAGMFRRGFSLDPAQRPTASEWHKVLLDELLAGVYGCDDCGGPNMIDTARVACSLCGKMFPLLALEGSFGRLPLCSASVSIGRDQLGGSSQVSKRHAIIRRRGPESFLEDISTNGTARLCGETWLTIPQHRECMIRAGDRLRFGDVEAGVVAIM